MANNKKSDDYSSQPNKVLYIMMGVITLFLIFVTVKLMMLEKKVSSIASGTVGGVQQESPLSVANLKTYAKELKLDTGKFEKCLDSGDKKTLIDNDTKYGASLGVQGTPGFFINGKFLGGAFPFQFFKEIIDKEIDGTATGNCTDYSADLQKYCSDPQQQAFFPEPKEIDTKNMVATGAKNGKVTIVEFSDFECPFCIKAFPIVEQVLNTYKNDVSLYFKQFPLTQIHQQAEKAAEASLCAADQGKFWQFHNKLFTLESAK